MARTKTAEKVEELPPIAAPANDVAQIDPPRIPYHQDITNRFGIDRGAWRVICESVFPSAKSFDAIVMALSYCKARGLDVFKKPVHIVPMWSSSAGKMIETCWPGINEYRTTAFRTGQYAGMAAPEFGPTIEHTFEGTASRGFNKGQKRTVTVRFPEWCRVTIKRTLNGQERTFVGPTVYWLETYAKWADTDVPNEMWANRPFGQVEKCAEAGGLRRAFPEDIGNDPTAEEMEGQRIFDPGALAREVQPVRDTAPPPPPPPAPVENSSAESDAQWLRDLEGACGGCEDVESLVAVQTDMMMPRNPFDIHGPHVVPPAIWEYAKGIFAKHFERIAGPVGGEDTEQATLI